MSAYAHLVVGSFAGDNEKAARHDGRGACVYCVYEYAPNVVNLYRRVACSIYCVAVNEVFAVCSGSNGTSLFGCCYIQELSPFFMATVCFDTVFGHIKGRGGVCVVTETKIFTGRHGVVEI